MGFSTTMTTQLKSVGDAVQIIALLISGAIILNVRNCTYMSLHLGASLTTTQHALSLPL
jgi:hypothetical protein